MEEQEKKKISPLTIVLGVLLIVAVGVILFLCLRGGDKTPGDVPTVIGGGEPIPGAEKAKKDANVIHLPAYSELTLAAGKKEQTLVLQNPGENTCLVCISLTLKDGTVIYRSELVEPGYYTRPITLIAPMERGIYRDVTLKYDCYTNDESKSPLNGATCKLDITVK